ncbi:DUF4114 domain-containing protein [Cystobacter ferrugineus]|uniref:DUF4114 domain-containing protein n=1 Tax=Cystobacter ferrugineus TaxID=83449 RepID=A0A1L9BHG3_9BACT|nr:DUF4114 domain-containing protein [Cystobacter ferrugineus]OJH41701.1 hypothetical protein BON30_00165 [Cystobacter ferrugineus]
MHASRPTLLLALLCASSSSWADSPGSLELCHDATEQDRQPDFKALDFKDLSSISVTKDNPPALRLDTNLEVLNPERIYFPFTQQVRVSYLYEEAGNSTALGYFYYQDLVERRFINQGANLTDSSDDTLADNDGNGIADFHEALFQMTDATSLNSTGRRCGNKFSYTYTNASGGKKTSSLYVPELASKDCGGHFNDSANVVAAHPITSGSRPTLKVGLLGQDGSADSADQFSDRGLYRSMPNLLEPRDAKNSFKGIGHLVFLHSDDDGDKNTGGNLGPVADVSTVENGIPDYNVSAYDTDGRPWPTPPDNQLDQENDRTVNLGEIQGDREIVFFAVSWGSAGHNPVSSGDAKVYPCLSFKANSNICALYLKTPTYVYFSKTFLNLDQNPQVAAPKQVDGQSFKSVAEMDIGCAYTTNKTRCRELNLWGWLDQATLDRLKNVPAYNNLVMPHERAFVKADTSGRDLMPHVLVGAPSTDKYRWVLGFEDLPGGGDRDFNDVSFMIHKSNGGRVRSGVVSGDLSPDIAQDFTITEVTFRAHDESYYAQSSTDAAFCRSRAAADRPRIRYQVALDCKVCTSNCASNNPVMSVNPNPTWVDVPLDAPPADGKRDQTVTLRDFLERSLTGSQLCWQAVMESKYDQCQPTIKNINVFYKAVKAGDYGRAAVSTVANTVLYGTFETPGRKWFEPGNQQPSVRVLDGRPDLSERGHLYLRKLFHPELPTSTVTVNGVEWDSGNKLSTDLRSTTTPDPVNWRKLITMNPQGQRTELKSVLTDDNGGEAFSSNNCGTNNGGNWVCDLDASGGPPDNADRALLRNWLYGWEQRTGDNKDTKRTWAMGGVQLSTPAIIGASAMPSWVTLAKGQEQNAYVNNFMKDSRVSARSTMAYVGTTQGFLYGVDAGELRLGDDGCTSTPEANGYFKVKSSQKCPANTNDPKPYPREYGEATEQFAYMPRKLLPYYVGTYLRQGNGKRASVDASPTVADVDLGFGSYDPTKGFSANAVSDKAWTIGPKDTVGSTEGAKTMLVAPTGPSHSVVFALDVTDPSSKNFPLPMWEFDMASDKIDFGGQIGKLTVEDAFADLGATGTLLPDTRGSRHAPTVTRMDFGSKGGLRWVALVGTDYVPNPNTAGSLFLLDAKTGMPVQLPGAQSATKTAGVIPLALNEGISGEPLAVDANDDGNAELIYAATTQGKIYRIATNKVDATRGFGRVLQVCKIADIQTELKNSSKPEYQNEAKFQGVYSTMGATLYREASGKGVRLYVGTGNNPDISDEPADLQKPTPHGYVLAFEDRNPTGTSCNNAVPLWIKQLGAGQMVWGGIELARDENGNELVNTSTAVGKAANACSLSGTQSGMFYSINSANPEPDKQATGTELGGHSLAAPVMHDGHMIMLTADGKVLVRGDPKKWNNPPGGSDAGQVRVHMWDADPSGVVKP